MDFYYYSEQSRKSLNTLAVTPESVTRKVHWTKLLKIEVFY